MAQLLRAKVSDYDVEGRLTSVKTESAGLTQTTFFFYDAGGNRTRTLYPNGTNVYTPYPDYEEEVPSGANPTITQPLARSRPVWGADKRALSAARSTPAGRSKRWLTKVSAAGADGGGAMGVGRHGRLACSRAMPSVP